MKKVMVYAYTAFNLGDDLFIKILTDRYQDTKFILYAPRQYKNSFKYNKNIIIFPNDYFIIKVFDFICRKTIGYSLFRKLISLNCDVAVYIGGSLFIERKNWKRVLKDVKNMKLRNKPFFLLGANFGPFRDINFYNEYKKVFMDFTDICFREVYSYDLFNDLKNVRKADDIIFQLETNIVKKSNNNTNNIVISVIKPSIKYNKNYDGIYYKKIRDIAMYFIQKGYNVTLMSFCKYEGDQEAVNTIVNLIPKKYLSNVFKFFYETNIEEALKVISNSNFVLATRFHSMILGWLYNKPVFPIVYSEKMSNIINDVDFTGLYIDLKSIGSLQPEEVFKSINTNRLDVTKQKIDSVRHFEKLDKYLSEHE